MGTEGSSTGEMSSETLAVFTRLADSGEPLTTSEVAEEMDCARRTTYGKLERLAETGELETKKVGARGRVWWRPSDGDDGSDGDDAVDGGDAADGHGSNEGHGPTNGRDIADRDDAVDRHDGANEGSPSTDDAPYDDLKQAQFRQLTEAVTDYAIFVLDDEGRVRTWNEGAERIKGYEEAEIVGEHFSTFYTEEDRDDGRPAHNLEAARTEGRIEDEGWRVRDDGTTFWANVVITALRDDDGTHQGYVKITRDMTTRHEQEERLRKEKERFEALVREVKDYAIFLLDPEGIVQTWNQGAKELKGYEEAEIVGEHVSTFYTEEDRENGRPQTNLDTAAEEGRVEDEGERVRKDGETFWANVVITALHDDDGDVRGYAKVTRDMTERHRYEQRLREQRDELDELNQINEVIRDIDQALVTATTREGIEQAVCDRLAASDTYEAAWIGEFTDGYEDITPRTWAGVSDGYLESIRDANADVAATMEKGVGATALQTKTIQPVQELHGDLDGEAWREASLEEGFESAITVPLVYNDVEYGILTVYADDETAFDDRKIAVVGELGETVSHAIAAVRRKERERTLTALQESTRELLHSETKEEIGDVIVETLTGDLALADALVYVFDTTENTLDPVSSSFHADSYTSQLTPLSAGADSPVWTSFMNGDSRVTESVLPAREMGSRRSMVVPLGDHGVLVVATAEQGTFDDDSRNLVELVAATGEAAFDRVESQANLKERDELLQDQNQRLQRLNGINTIIREIDQGLVQATTPEEIQRVVCDRLTRSDRFRFAWIGTPADVEDGLVPKAWSGDGRGYLDSIDLGQASGRGGSEPAVTAARTGEVTVVANVADDLRGGPWRKEAFSREFQSVIGVPLTYDEVTYGVLTVYADRPAVFEEMEQSVFAELGETIANAMHTVNTKQALLTEQAVELEFHLQNESASFLSRIASEVGCELTFEGAIPLTEDRARLFFLARDGSADDLDDALNRSVVVESHELLGTRDDGHLVEAVVTGPTIPISLLEQGASLNSLTVTDGDVRLVMEVPSNTDVREFIHRFQTQYESAEFMARRQRERPVQTRNGIRAELRESLTDRQLDVLRTAYHSGYFASPRQATGSGIADLLDVSQPTVTEQLRAAQRKILDLLLADSTALTE